MMTHLPPKRSVPLALVALLAIGCSTGPDRLNVGGNWQGTTLLPNAYSTTLALIQSGSTVSGDLTIAGVLDASFIGTLDEGTRVLAWTLVDGCEQWSGTFTASSDGSEMSGPVLVDVSGCAGGTNSSGSISLSKQ